MLVFATLITSGLSGSVTGKQAGSCASYGCVGYTPENSCQCNPSCAKYNSCCPDREPVCARPSPPPAPPLAPGGCSTAEWPDVEVVCDFATDDHPGGDCKALVDKIKSVYKNCDGYCSSIGRLCVNAFEEKSDSCTVKEDFPMDCSTEVDSTDAICECGTATSALDQKIKKLSVNLNQKAKALKDHKLR
jgi:hypothetical protein